MIYIGHASHRCSPSAILFHHSSLWFTLPLLLMFLGATESQAQLLTESDFPEISADRSPENATIHRSLSILLEIEEKAHPIPREKDHLWGFRGCKNVFVPRSENWFGFSTGGLFRIWSMRDGEEIQTIQHPGREGSEDDPDWMLATSHDEAILITARESSPTICFWDRITGELLHSISVLKTLNTTKELWRPIQNIGASPDGQLLAVRVSHGDIPTGGLIIWINIPQMQVLSTTTGPHPYSMEVDSPGPEYYPMEFTSNDTLMFLGIPENRWEHERNGMMLTATPHMRTAKGRLISSRPKEGYSKVCNFAVSIQKGLYAILRKLPEDEKSSELEYEIVIKRISDHTEVRRFLLPELDSTRHLELSTDGASLLFETSRDGTWVVDIESGDPRGRFDIDDARFLSGSTRLIGTSSFRRHHKNLALWTVPEKKLLVEFVPFPVRRWWATATRDGYFHASPEVIDAIANWDEKDRTYFSRERPSMESVVTRDRREDAVRLALVGIDSATVRNLPAGYFPPSVTLRVVKSSQNQAKIAVVVQHDDSESKAVHCNLERLERPLADELQTIAFGPDIIPERFPDNWLAEQEGVNRSRLASQAIEVRKNSLPRFQIERSINVPFPPGKNEMTLRATVTDSHGIQSLPTSLKLRRPVSVQELPGRLIVLSIGVSTHKYSEYDLRYPADDARAITGLFQSQEGLAYGEVQTQLYVDKKATRENVHNGLAWLKRTCTPDDVAIFFIAGHGIRGRRGLYYVPHEGDAESMQNTCLNWDEVALTLKETHAKHVLFLSDVCHAGAFARTQLAMQKKLAEAVENLQHVTVLTASGPNEAALEQDAWSHGAFTAGILKSFDPDEDADDDGAISIQELIQSTTRHVRDLTQGIQTPTTPFKPNTDFSVGRIHAR